MDPYPYSDFRSIWIRIKRIRIRNNLRRDLIHKQLLLSNSNKTTNPMLHVIQCCISESEILVLIGPFIKYIYLIMYVPSSPQQKKLDCRPYTTVHTVSHGMHLQEMHHLFICSVCYNEDSYCL